MGAGVENGGGPLTSLRFHGLCTSSGATGLQSTLVRTLPPTRGQREHRPARGSRGRGDLAMGACVLILR